jgi:hypothetical protein
MRITLAIACIAINAATFAQDAIVPDDRQLAEQNAKEIAQMVGLDAGTTEELTRALTTAGKESADLRAQCAKIDMQVNAIYDKNMESVVARMPAPQREKYMELVKAGKIKHGSCSAAGCSTGAKTAAGCSAGKGEAKAGGCCAGKAQADAKPAEQKVAPEKK